MFLIDFLSYSFLILPFLFLFSLNYIWFFLYIFFCCPMHVRKYLTHFFWTITSRPLRYLIKNNSTWTVRYKFWNYPYPLKFIWTRNQTYWHASYPFHKLIFVVLLYCPLLLKIIAFLKLEMSMYWNYLREISSQQR